MRKRRHETFKCFPTKCKYCGSKVLYWESTAGAKVFFNLPIYGKPIRHNCRKKGKKKSYVLETYEDHLKKRQKKMETFQCPVCAKIFPRENALNAHIKDLRKYDENHAQFFNEILDFLDLAESSLKTDEQNHSGRFTTKHSTKTMKGRFILKAKNPKDKKKFEKLLRRR